MRLLGSVGLGLSVVFACLLLALVAQIYYLLWWKKRVVLSREIVDDNDHTNSSTKSCFKTQAFSTTTQVQQELNFHTQIANKPLFDEQNGTNNDCLGSDDDEELIITMPPMFLFTIKEETKEEMESSLEDIIVARKGKRKSLSDLMKSVEVVTPYTSPDVVWNRESRLVSSPDCKTSLGCGGFNPIYEYSNESEFNRIGKSSSPPPKFKFLRNAEEKLLRKNMVMEQMKRERYLGNVGEGVAGSFVTIIVAQNNKENDDNIIKPNYHYHSPIYMSL